MRFLSRVLETAAVNTAAGVVSKLTETGAYKAVAAWRERQQKKADAAEAMEDVRQKR